MNRNRYILFFCLTAALATILSAALLLASLEIYLRLKGKKPFTLMPTDEDSVIVEPDPVRGWRNRPGVYTRWPARWAGDEWIKVTVWPAGNRATAQAPREGGRVIAVGCSYMAGFAISDEETLAWKLQKIFPRLEILNYGTPGYGTYQALLLLEDYLRTSPAPQMVIYGFVDFHQQRNVAAVEWQRNIRRKGGRGHAQVPYVTLDREGRLVRHAPEAYTVWPLSRHSAAIDFLQSRLLSLRSGRSGASRQRLITAKLLVAMNDLCKARGTRLLVCVLGCRDADLKEYLDMLAKNGIEYVVCIPPRNTEIPMRAREGHPSPELNSFWAARIAEYLKKTLLASKTAEAVHGPPRTARR